jgi:hypothetical protein
MAGYQRLTRGASRLAIQVADYLSKPVRHFVYAHQSFQVLVRAAAIAD